MSQTPSRPDPAASAASAAAPAAPVPGERFSLLALEALHEFQRPLGEQIMKVSSIGLEGPYRLLLRSPVLGQRIYDLLYYLRWNSSIPMRLSEFAILIIGRHWTSQVEWYAHAPIAAKAGLAQSIIDDLKARRRPANMQPDEAVVHDFLTELIATHRVSDDTFARARAVFDEQQLVDLTAVAGTYVMVAMLLAMADIPVPPGKTPPFGPDGA
ncbi:MAG: carboxymuconolactone decarboxylase family protein [Lautropia sp.]